MSVQPASQHLARRSVHFGSSFRSLSTREMSQGDTKLEHRIVKLLVWLCDIECLFASVHAILMQPAFEIQHN